RSASLPAVVRGGWGVAWAASVWVTRPRLVVDSHLSGARHGRVCARRVVGFPQDGCRRGVGARMGTMTTHARRSLDPDEVRGLLQRPVGPLARVEVVPRTGSTNLDVTCALRADATSWP